MHKNDSTRAKILRKLTLYKPELLLALDVHALLFAMDRRRAALDAARRALVELAVAHFLKYAAALHLTSEVI